MRRAAMVLGAAMTLGAIEACDPQPAPSAPTAPIAQPAQPGVNDPGGVVALYGAPAVPPQPNPGNSPPVAPQATRYGAPPAFDDVV
jgi:hypothetical protein